MKKFLSLLLVVLIVSAVQASPALGVVSFVARGQDMVQRYMPKEMLENRFWEAVDKGQTDFIAHIEKAELLTLRDKFGNNCFHRAKDAATVQALAATIRRLYPTDAPKIFHDLINQRNYNMNEIPAQTQLSYGKADTFNLLFSDGRGTAWANADLAVSISKLRSTMNLTGPLAISSSLEKGRVRVMSQDAAGRTIAQVALANADKPGMDKVISYFQFNAPYLF